MSNPIDNALGLRPYEMIDQKTGEVTEVTPVQEHPIVDEDPALAQAMEDAEQVRSNLKRLIEQGTEIFEDVSNVAKQTQNFDGYQATARMYSELIKANKELMNVHRDVHFIKPPAPREMEGPQVVNNTYIAATSQDLMRALKERGLGNRNLPSPNGPTEDS